MYRLHSQGSKLTFLAWGAAAPAIGNAGADYKSPGRNILVYKLLHLKIDKLWLSLISTSSK